ncbi:MAG: hypothetical protein P8Y97_03300 [Candidatus Lokiarchaeota archaeon]
MEVFFRFFEFPNIQDPEKSLNIDFLKESNIQNSFKLLTEPDRIKKLKINFKIPNTGNPCKREDLILRMFTISEEDANYNFLEKNNIINSIILGRSNMIIQYKKIQDFIPVENFLGYLMVTKEQPESLMFFRTSEPPSHNEWKTTSDRLKDNYGQYAGPKALRKFNRKLEELIRNEFGFKIDKEENIERIKKQTWNTC